MTTTKVTHKVVKDANRAIGFDKFDYLMMEIKQNITEASSQSKDQASVYNI